MENSVSMLCNDVKLVWESNEKIVGQFICYDASNKPIKTILAPIHKQIKEIYRNKITVDFVKRLEYKLKFTMKIRPALLMFVNQKDEWMLQTPLCEIYEPVTLTTGCIKVGDNPLTINAEVIELFCDKGKVFLQCLVKEISTESNEFELVIRNVKINEEVNSIYGNKESREKARKVLSIKVKNKEAFINALAAYLKGKILKLEYDEHYGYSLWTFIYDFIVVDDANK